MMMAPANWIEALSGGERATARILFARLGLVARCRALSSEELAECIEMGGEKGARYAVYLSCAELREAGEQLRLRGEILSPFDITRGIPYADAIAAAGIIVRLSGGSEAMVRMLDDEESDEEAIARGMDGRGSAPVGTSDKDNPFAASAPGAVGQVQEADSFFALVGQQAVGDDWIPDYALDAEDSAEAEDIHLIRTSAPNAAISYGRNSGTSSAMGAGDTYGGFFAQAGAPGSAVFAQGDEADRLARLLADRLIDAAGNI